MEILNYWSREVKNVNENCMKVLIGNKLDLIEGDEESKKNRAVTVKEAQEFATKEDFDLFFECSAKNDNAKEITIKEGIEKSLEGKKGIETMFQRIAACWYKNFKSRSKKNLLKYTKEGLFQRESNLDLNSDLSIDSTTNSCLECCNCCKTNAE